MYKSEERRRIHKIRFFHLEIILNSWKFIIFLILGVKRIFKAFSFVSQNSLVRHFNLDEKMEIMINFYISAYNSVNYQKF